MEGKLFLPFQGDRFNLCGVTSRDNGSSLEPDNPICVDIITKLFETKIRDNFDLEGLTVDIDEEELWDKILDVLISKYRLWDAKYNDSIMSWLAPNSPSASKRLPTSTPVGSVSDLTKKDVFNLQNLDEKILPSIAKSLAIAYGNFDWRAIRAAIPNLESYFRSAESILRTSNYEISINPVNLPGVFIITDYRGIVIDNRPGYYWSTFEGFPNFYSRYLAGDTDNIPQLNDIYTCYRQGRHKLILGMIGELLKLRIHTITATSQNNRGMGRLDTKIILAPTVEHTIAVSIQPWKEYRYLSALTPAELIAIYNNDTTKYIVQHPDNLRILTSSVISLDSPTIPFKVFVGTGALEDSLTTYKAKQPEFKTLLPTVVSKGGAAIPPFGTVAVPKGGSFHTASESLPPISMPGMHTGAGSGTMTRTGMPGMMTSTMTGSTMGMMTSTMAGSTMGTDSGSTLPLEPSTEAFIDNPSGGFGGIGSAGAVIDNPGGGAIVRAGGGGTIGGTTVGSAGGEVWSPAMPAGSIPGMSTTGFSPAMPAGSMPSGISGFGSQQMFNPVVQSTFGQATLGQTSAAIPVASTATEQRMNAQLLSSLATLSAPVPAAAVPATTPPSSVTPATVPVLTTVPTTMNPFLPTTTVATAAVPSTTFVGPAVRPTTVAFQPAPSAVTTTAVVGASSTIPTWGWILIGFAILLVILFFIWLFYYATRRESYPPPLPRLPPPPPVYPPPVYAPPPLTYPLPAYPLPAYPPPPPTVPLVPLPVDVPTTLAVPPPMPSLATITPNVSASIPAGQYAVGPAAAAPVVQPTAPITVVVPGQTGPVRESIRYLGPTQPQYVAQAQQPIQYVIQQQPVQFPQRQTEYIVQQQPAQFPQRQTEYIVQQQPAQFTLPQQTEYVITSSLPQSQLQSLQPVRGAEVVIQGPVQPYNLAPMPVIQPAAPINAINLG